MAGGVHPALIGQLAERDVTLSAEQVHKDARPDNRHHPGLGTDALINLVVAVPVSTEVVLPALQCHRLQPVGRYNTAFLVNALDDVIHLSAQPFVEQIVKHIALGLVTVVLRLLDGVQHRDDDLEVAVVGDGVANLRIAGQPFHTLDSAGEDLLSFERLNQVQQVAAQLIVLSLHSALGINGHHPRAALPGHPQFGPRARCLLQFAFGVFQACHLSLVGNSGLRHGRLGLLRRHVEGRRNRLRGVRAIRSIASGGLVLFRKLAVRGQCHLSLGSPGFSSRVRLRFKASLGGGVP